MLTIYHVGFHPGGRRSYISLLVVFCTYNAEALAGCWLKPVPCFDIYQEEMIHV